MVKSLSIAEARSRLTQLPEQLAEQPDDSAIAITRRGKPVLAVLPWELYESILETLEILGDPAQMAALHEGIEAARAGRTVSLSELEERLGR
jgi:prevent-host-death family protein